MPFAGSSRFELLGKLGEGGMGIVYEARDRSLNIHVALKTLRHLEATSLYRFKREFRAVSDLSHPNIVTLYELVAAADEWFFTMEVVRGGDIIEYVRAMPQAAGVDTPAYPMTSLPHGDVSTVDPSAADLADATPADLRARTGGPPAEIGELVDLDRIRHAFGQLARALHALHQAGLVHRDLKPANVRVTDEGRVVLMDFGIVADRAEGSVVTRTARAVGTPAYMAPEQITGDPPTAAADWYAFGAMLYLALTGHLPFAGSSREILRAKLREAPVPIEELVRGVPDDLRRLCTRLLDRRPRRRPAPGYTLGVFGLDLAEVARDMAGGEVFVGREREQKILHDALAAARDGASASVLVVGDSGMGKSTLVRHFLDAVLSAKSPAPGGPDAIPVVLTGRCHERESLSFNAFDGVIDSLSHVLLDLPERAAEELLPRDIGLLTRLFPVLCQVPAIERAGAGDDLHPRELRAAAARVLRELVHALRQRQPVVIYIDDLQWADRDSLDLLVEIMRDATGVLLIGTLRAEDPDSPAWQTLASLPAQVACHRVTLGPLSASERHDLIEELIARHPAAASLRTAEALWSEADSSPLLLVELVRFLEEAGADGDAGALDLEALLWRRIERLPAATRALLQATAVAGEARPYWMLAAAATLSAEAGQNALMLLRSSRLIRIVQPGADPWITTSHARVREVLLSRLEPELRRTLHAGLAAALESWGQASPDALAHHWRFAGDKARARSYLVAAARHAEDKLAFDRAAELYREALELGNGGDDTTELMHRLGDALQLAGRSYEAATVYERTAAGAGRELAIELGRLAADEWLRSGHVRRGVERLAEVMREVGVRYARTRAGAILSLLYQRARLRLRGQDWQPRPADELSAQGLARIDTLYAASVTLGFIDHLRGTTVQTHHLLLALDSGEEHRVCRALALEHGFLRVSGSHTAAVEALGDEVMALARRLDDPYTLGVVLVCRGGALYFSGQSAEAEATLLECDELLRASRRAVEWERRTAQYLLSLSRITTGHLSGAMRADDHYVPEAERRNDVYARTMFLCVPGTWSLLSADQPDEADARLDTATRGWPEGDFYVAGYVQAYARGLVRLYRGEGQAALDIMDRALPDIRRLMLHRVPWVWSEISTMVARAALMAPDTWATRRRFHGAVRALERTGMPYAQALAALLRAGRLARDGDADSARDQLTAARAQFSSLAARHLVAACDLRLGQLQGGAEGEALGRRGEDDLCGCGAVDTRRMLHLLAPGF